MKLTNLFFAGALVLMLATACETGVKHAPSVDSAAIEDELQQMTLREKVGQLFCVRPESLDPDFLNGSVGMYTYKLQAVSPAMQEYCKQYPVGGVTLFSHNVGNPEQLTAFTEALKALPGNPLLSIDEEGGRVSRIAGNEAFPEEESPSMADVSATGSTKKAYDVAEYIGGYLKKYGFDIDFAPVADVNTNPENVVIGNRAFSNDPQVAAPYVVEYLKGLNAAGVQGCLKHFPGHGDTKADTHTGYAQSTKTWEEMLACEMVTFKAGIKAGAPMIMSAHIAAPAVTGTTLPSTLSSVILTEKLRGELGFEGVIITDAMAMGAISKQYTSAQGAIQCLQAGADIVLMPENLAEAFEAVIAAVENEELSEERIDESVRRVLTLKAICRK